MSAKNIINSSYRKVYCLGWESAYCTLTPGIFAGGPIFTITIFRFYPSLSSISTHFSKYRATALGVAIAGTSVGPLFLFLYFIFLNINLFPGGVVYPIVLECLFSKVGFSWGVRISGLVSAVICAIATLMVSSLFTQRKTGPYFDIRTLADIRFALLATGSIFVLLGEFITKKIKIMFGYIW